VSGGLHEVKSMVSRLMDHLKSKGITAVFTALSDADGHPESVVGVSSLMDTWIALRNQESGGEQSRLLKILKSRGTAHSNQVREFVISGGGVDLEDVYTGPEGVLTGSARAARESRERTEKMRRALKSERARIALEAGIASLNADLNRAEHELRLNALEAEESEACSAREREEISRARGAGGDRVDGR